MVADWYRLILCEVYLQIYLPFHVVHRTESSTFLAGAEELNHRMVEFESAEQSA